MPPQAVPSDTSDINGIGAFDKIAGETMYEYETSMAPMAPETPMAPEEQMAAQMAPMAPEASVATPQVEMYVRSPYAEL
jgi:hypothetical protein